MYGGADRSAARAKDSQCGVALRPWLLAERSGMLISVTCDSSSLAYGSHYGCECLVSI